METVPLLHQAACQLHIKGKTITRSIANNLHQAYISQPTAHPSRGLNLHAHSNCFRLDPSEYCGVGSMDFYQHNYVSNELGPEPPRNVLSVNSTPKQMSTFSLVEALQHGRSTSWNPLTNYFTNKTQDTGSQPDSELILFCS